MQINVEQIILNSLRKLNEENSLRLMALLNILHLNIDVLLNKSIEWFGDNPPDEFRSVLNSLIVLTTSFLEGGDVEDFLSEQDPELVEVSGLVEELIHDASQLFGFEKEVLVFDRHPASWIMVPKREFRKSLNDILLVFRPFMSMDTSCTFSVSENKTNLVIKINYERLSSSFPGIRNIQKPFFSYTVEPDEVKKIGMGLISATSGLSEMGAVVQLKPLHGGNSCQITITFPSMEFLETMAHVREDNKKHQTSRPVQTGTTGTVLIAVSDLIVEMILSEVLTESGYSVKRVSPKDIAGLIEETDTKGLVIDHSSVSAAAEVIAPACKSGLKTVVLHETDIAGEEALEGARYFRKPIELESIVGFLKGD